MSATEPAVDPEIVEQVPLHPGDARRRRSSASTRRRCAAPGTPTTSTWSRTPPTGSASRPSSSSGLLARHGALPGRRAGQVTNELVPMLAAAHRLRRFDWTMYLATFMVEEARHAEFFMLWHRRVVGMLEPEDCARHFLSRSKTIDPTGRFEIRDIMHDGPAALRRALIERLRRRQRGRGRARLRALLDRLQRDRRGRADDAVVRDRDRHLRRSGTPSRRSSRGSAASWPTRAATSRSARRPAAS